MPQHRFMKEYEGYHKIEIFYHCSHLLVDKEELPQLLIVTWLAIG